MFALNTFFVSVSLVSACFCCFFRSDASWARLSLSKVSLAVCLRGCGTWVFLACITVKRVRVCPGVCGASVFFSKVLSGSCVVRSSSSSGLFLVRGTFAGSGFGDYWAARAGRHTWLVGRLAILVCSCEGASLTNFFVECDCPKVLTGDLARVSNCYYLG